MRSLFYICLFYQPPPKVPEVTCEHPDFHYTFEVLNAEKVCFGNSAERSTNLNGKGLSSQQQRVATEVFPNVSPNKYNIEPYSSSMWPILNKIRSIYGVPGLANKKERWTEKKFKTPSPTHYALAVFRRRPKQNAKPFCIGSEARILKIKNTPGPGFYKVKDTWKCRSVPGQYNFGKPEILPHIEMICVKTPIHTCQFCNKLCQGDYWHINKELFLCQVCWYIERVTNEYLTMPDLRKYKKIRNCSFMHQHDDTTAALRILSPEKVKKKLKLENYLNLYISCYD